MSHAQICPICGGKGKIEVKGDSTLTYQPEEICYGCLGTGWVEVSDK